MTLQQIVHELDEIERGLYHRVARIDGQGYAQSVWILSESAQTRFRELRLNLDQAVFQAKQKMGTH